MIEQMEKVSAFSAKSILTARYAAQTFALIVLHQSIVASSAFLLTQVIANFQEGLPYQQELYLYFLAMLAPFIPGCLSFLTLTKWENEIHGNYVKAAKRVVEKRIDLYKNAALKNEFVGALSRNSFAVTASICSYLHSSLTFFLNSLLSILVIGLILPLYLSVGYAISVAISMVVVFFVSPVISGKTMALENANIAYGGVLSKIWANMTVGNVYNSKLWEISAETDGKKYYEVAENISLIKQGNNFLLGMIALLPTMYLIYEAARSDTSAAIMAAIIVSLTRIIHILNSFGSLIYQAINLRSVISRVEVLSSLLEKLEGTKNFLPFEAAGAVKINGEKIDDFGQFAESIEKMPAGRYTVTGENGAGKSNLLLYIKSKLGDSCFLLPVNAGEFNWKTQESNASTGQNLLSIVQEVVENAKVKVFLLDEWDANLDIKNKHAISTQLDVISQKCVIVEVRHGELLKGELHGPRTQTPRA